jgi:hypothetical protein
MGLLDGHFLASAAKGAVAISIESVRSSAGLADFSIGDAVTLDGSVLPGYAIVLAGAIGRRFAQPERVR